MARRASGSRAGAPGEPSRQTGSVHCELHYWWFGFAHYAGDPAEHPMVGKLGQHFMDLSLDDFRALQSGRRGAIKTFLLDQSRVVGIGNVYVQDPLWKARSTPCAPSRLVKRGELYARAPAFRGLPSANKNGIMSRGRAR